MQFNRNIKSTWHLQTRVNWIIVVKTQGDIYVIFIFMILRFHFFYPILLKFGQNKFVPFKLNYVSPHRSTAPYCLQQHARLIRHIYTQDRSMHTPATYTLIAGWSIAVVMDAAFWCTRCPLTCNWICRVQTLYHDRTICATGHRLLNGW